MRILTLEQTGQPSFLKTAGSSSQALQVIFEYFLENAGINGQVDASTAIRAINGKISFSNYDLIVVDSVRDYRAALNTTRQIRAQIEEGENVKILFYHNDDINVDIKKTLEEEAKKAGADHYINSPNDPKHLAREFFALFPDLAPNQLRPLDKDYIELGRVRISLQGKIIFQAKKTPDDEYSISNSFQHIGSALRKILQNSTGNRPTTPQNQGVYQIPQQLRDRWAEANLTGIPINDEEAAFINVLAKHMEEYVYAKQIIREMYEDAAPPYGIFPPESHAEMLSINIRKKLSSLGETKPYLILVGNIKDGFLLNSQEDDFDPEYERALKSATDEWQRAQAEIKASENKPAPPNLKRFPTSFFVGSIIVNTEEGVVSDIGSSSNFYINEEECALLETLNVLRGAGFVRRSVINNSMYRQAEGIDEEHITEIFDSIREKFKINFERNPDEFLSTRNGIEYCFTHQDYGPEPEL